jgi:hypothetical protein
MLNYTNIHSLPLHLGTHTKRPDVQHAKKIDGITHMFCVETRPNEGREGAASLAPNMVVVVGANPRRSKWVGSEVVLVLTADRPGCSNQVAMG